MGQAFQTIQVFIPFSVAHYLPIAIAVAICIALIVFSRMCLDDLQTGKLGIIISIIPMFCVLFRMYKEYEMGIFSSEISLPLHLCRVSALILPFVVYYRSRFWIVVLYFWNLTGTLFALVTPELKEGFPHWSYLCYFFLHAGLIVCILYIITAFKIRIGWKDYRNVFITTLAYGLLTIPLNFLFKSNYMYTVGKPPVATLLDSLGEWPIYLIWCLLLVLVLNLILMVPFLILRRNYP